MSLIHEFLKNEDAAAAAEYGLLLTLVAVATIASVTALGDQLVLLFNSAAERIGDAVRGS